jgi:hypothetical protein
LQALRQTLKNSLKPEIQFVPLEVAINDQAFTDKILELLDEMMKKAKS